RCCSTAAPTSASRRTSWIPRPSRRSWPTSSRRPTPTRGCERRDRAARRRAGRGGGDHPAGAARAQRGGCGRGTRVPARHPARGDRGRPAPRPDASAAVRGHGPVHQDGPGQPGHAVLLRQPRRRRRVRHRGVRGTTADLSFQVLAGNYSADDRAASHAAFDDRALEIDDDGRYSFRLGPPRHDDDEGDAGYVVLHPGGSMIAVREVFSDWDTEVAGSATLRRVDSAGTAPQPPTVAGQEKFYAKLAEVLIGRLRTWLAFPDWFFGDQERNTLYEPRQTPGGLTTQFS